MDVAAGGGQDGGAFRAGAELDAAATDVSFIRGWCQRSE